VLFETEVKKNKKTKKTKKNKKKKNKNKNKQTKQNYSTLCECPLRASLDQARKGGQEKQFV
jgi:hypothetical protein